MLFDKIKGLKLIPCNSDLKDYNDDKINIIGIGKVKVNYKTLP